MRFNPEVFDAGKIAKDISESFYTLFSRCVNSYTTSSGRKCKLRGVCDCWDCDWYVERPEHSQQLRR